MKRAVAISKLLSLFSFLFFGPIAIRQMKNAKKGGSAVPMTDTDPTQ